MRRLTFLVLGGLECAIAVVLVVLGQQLPSRQDMSAGFHSAAKVTHNAGRQVQLLRRQVNDLRRPELHVLANQVQHQTRTVTAAFKDQQIDFDTVQAMSRALGEVANGLEGLAHTLDSATLGKLGEGLNATADFLDKQVVPGAERAAQQLEQTTQQLRHDAQLLGELLRQAPVDLRAARAVHDSLARFEQGLATLDQLLDRQRLAVMREGFQGMEEALATGADQVERLAGVTMPAVQWNGLKPDIAQRPLWPEGKQIAAGMRKAAAGATRAGQQMDSLCRDLPRLHATLQESRQAVQQTRDALAVALKQQDRLEPLLRQVPEQAARLAEDLPRIGDNLAHLLRQTSRLQEVAQALRRASQGLDEAAAQWPRLRALFVHTAALLRTTRGQLDQVLHHRPQYEAALSQSLAVAESFAATLPILTEQLDNRLAEEDHALNELSVSLEEVGAILPAYERTATSVIQSGRLLVWLMAILIGTHGCYLLLSVHLGRRYSF